MRANPNDLIRPSRGFVRAGDQIFVTLGRNVGSEPMSWTDWRVFISEALVELSALLIPSAVFGPFYGTGEWEGVTEGSALWSLTVGYTSRVEDVEAVLSTLAGKFRQDAIAWTTGAANLARP